MPKSPRDLLPVGEVSRRTGVPITALHYYEREGLITSQRSAGNQRRYARHMLRLISLIQVAKRLGVPLGEVKQVFAALPAGKMPNRHDWEQISRRWDARLAAREQEIRDLRRELAGCIGCGCLSLGACRLLNAQDSLAEQGPGPRRLTTATAGHRLINEVTDEIWARIEPLLPDHGRRGRRWRDHRQVVDGVLWQLRTGQPWRTMPARFGPWQTVYERYRRWTDDGTWDRLRGHLELDEPTYLSDN